MRIGLLLSGGSSGDAAGLVDASLALTAAARDAGFGAVVVGQHFLAAPHTYLQPIPLLARLIPESGQMRLATGVLLLPLLHPVQLAEDLATLDQLSQGRLIVGVGQGYRDVEFQAFGIDRKTRLDRQLESLEVLKQLWDGGSIEHHGKHYRIAADGAAVIPFQSPHPPIWYAASSDRTVHRAVEAGHTPYLGPQVDRSRVSVLLESAGSRGEVALRRDVLVRGIVNDETIRRCVAARDARYGSWGYREDGVADPATRTGPEGPYIVGSVAECREALARYAALGVTTVVVRTTWEELPVEASIEMVDALGEVAVALGGES